MNLTLAYGGIVGTFLFGAFAVRLVRHDFDQHGRLSLETTVLVWTVYLFHAGLTAVIAWGGLWPLSIPPVGRTGVGGLFIGSGLLIAGSAVREFRSVTRMSGRDEDELVTTGVYRWSRNPQNTGWILTLVGVSLVGASALALVSVALFALVIHVYLVYVEEPHLTRVFGDDYRAYRSRTPRYLGRQRSLDLRVT